MKEYNITKEKLVELIKMIKVLEDKLNDVGMYAWCTNARVISNAVRSKLDTLCGEEYLENLKKS